MAALKIYLFGSFRIIAQNPLTGMERNIHVNRSCQILLAYLLLNRHRTHPRELLAGLIWGDSSEEHARKSLNTAIWRLRNTLEPKGVLRGAYLVNTQHNEIGFNPASDHWFDVAIFECATAAITKHPEIAIPASIVREAEQAIQLYTGDLLDFSYENWVLREREHLRMSYLDCLSSMMSYYKSKGEYSRSILFAQKILDLDPLREEIHRELIHLYLANDQRSLAARQYALCRQTLERELGLPPMKETQYLYKAFVCNELPSTKSNPTSGVTSLPLAMAELTKAIQDLERSRQDLHAAMQVVEQFLTAAHA